MRARCTCALVIMLAIAGAAFVPAVAQCDPNWQTAIGVPGPSSTVWCALAVDEASAVGPAIYAGGQFTTAGGVSALNIAKWNGSAWSALSTGTGSTGTVYTLVAKDGYLYAGGGFASMGGQPSTRGIAKWNGSTWSTVGGGMAQSNSGPRAMVFLNNVLYVGGYQNEMGGVTLHKLGRWDGVSWSALPGDPIGSTDSVAALGVYDDGGGADLYVGGTFAAPGGNSYARNVFRWDGTSLTALGRGANDVVESFAVWNGSLYVGGHFTRVYQNDGTEVVANKIARWDGTQWYALGSGLTATSGNHVWALSVFDRGTGDALYAGGSFTTAGGATIRYVATWDGATWGAVGQSNLNGYVYALPVSKYDGGLYLGGTFTTAGVPSANRFVRWAGPRPVSPANATALPPAITIGDSSTLSASVAGATIAWYTGGCGGTFVGTGDSLVVSPSVTTTYYARAYNGTCYSYACSPVTVTVSCAPAAPANTQAAPAAIVLGDSSTLTASVSGSTIYWYTGGCGTTLIGTGNSLMVTPSVTTTYYARAYNGACFSDLCGSATVTVDCAPPAPLNAAAEPTSILLGDSSTLTASVSGSTIYWYTGGCGTTPVGTGSPLIVSPTDTTTYYARAYNGTCFSNACGTATVTVQCTPPTPANTAADPAVIQLGDSATLTASVPNATIYWYTGGCGTTLIGTGSPLIVTPTVTTAYYARAFNGTCFSNSCGNVTVTVNCVPLTFTQQPVGGMVCPGHSLQLCVAAEGTGTLHYQWKRGGLSLIGATGPCYTATQAGAYTCVVTDDCTPIASDIAQVHMAAPQLGDFDGDGHADIEDFDLLAACLMGPDEGISSGCECVDVAADGQIDIGDFAAFQVIYTN